MFLFLWQSVFKLSDVGVTVLLKFLSLFFHTLSKVFNLPILRDFAAKLPTSVVAGKKILGTNCDKFEKFVCCTSCSSLYTMNDSLEKLPNGSIVSKSCKFIHFPNHPQRHQRKECGATLLKTVKTSSGSMTLYPRMLYCYKSLTESLQQFLLREDFFESCEKWRKRTISVNCLDDVYDGQVWKDFLTYDGKPFLSAPFNFGLSLNVDWFQPFKHTNHSVGAIYVAIQNLPREERFLSENIILLGVIPCEPTHVMNTLLNPLVDELLTLWDGVIMKSSMQNSVIVRAALLCVSCDIPAARKVCGFVGHRGFKACTKCLKDFPTESFGDLPDYSGFEREKWPIRTNTTHRQFASEYLACQTKSEQKQNLKKHGCRYSVLLRLSYFDPIRMCVIDPMHNLLLGTAKHMVTIWKDLKNITS